MTKLCKDCVHFVEEASEPYVTGYQYDMCNAPTEEDDLLRGGKRHYWIKASAMRASVPHSRGFFLPAPCGPEGKLFEKGISGTPKRDAPDDPMHPSDAMGKRIWRQLVRLLKEPGHE